VFSIREREELRDRLIEAAHADDRIVAAALVGSGARDAEDAWSDVDLALRLGEGLDTRRVADDWTARMYESEGAVDHLDVWAATTLFRVFLLSSSLQVDLSFHPSASFAATGASFRLLFGEANEPRTASPPVAGDLIGMGWLYALHARSSIERGRTLQALHMINGVRDHVIALACVRHELPAHQGRGVDDLPAALRQRIATTIVRSPEEPELRRAFAMSVEVLLDEARHADPDRERRLRGVARELVQTAGEPLEPHECRVWWATIAGSGPHLEALLSSPERERWRAYAKPDDRLRFLTGAAMLRLTAAACLSVAPEALRVDRRCARCAAQHGKPRLLDHPDVDVSVSHAGEHVAVALARGPRIGVDVERIRDVDVDELARSAFSSDEAAGLAALPAADRTAAFYALWTHKESIAKALGTGITDDFASVSAIRTGASVRELACAPGYVATLATLGRCDRITVLDAQALMRNAAPAAPGPR
jgi:phosphopantetheinyl transferase/predicted nucleotidyltransferase